MTDNNSSPRKPTLVLVEPAAPSSYDFIVQRSPDGENEELGAPREDGTPPQLSNLSPLAGDPATTLSIVARIKRFCDSTNAPVPVGALALLEAQIAAGDAACKMFEPWLRHQVALRRVDSDHAGAEEVNR